MGYAKKSKGKDWKASVRESEFGRALSNYSSNLYRSFVKDDTYTSYLKALHRDDSTWLAMCGVWTNEGLPVVYFGHGRTFLDALRSLSGAMAANKHKPDQYGLPAPFLSIP